MAVPAPIARPDAAEPRPETAAGGVLPPIMVAAAVAFGLLCGAFEITNTSIGWHIASGRWMLAHHEVLDHDPFSFTSGGVEWIDHEWLFQIVVAALFDLGGPPALVGLRMLVIAALTVLLLRIGVGGGLDPPAALVLAALCVWAARPRFFVRPELATLLLLPLALWLFADRRRRRWWPLPLAAVVVAGVNLHGAMLVAPALIAVWFAGETLGQLLRRDLDRGRLVCGVAGVAAALVATLVNPFGWRIWTVPFRLAELVSSPHIPNPEWIAPGVADSPALFVALGLAALALAVGSRAPQHWLTLAATAALALRHIRNIGVFFVLLPMTAAPALARWSLLAGRSAPSSPGRRARTAAGLGLVAVLAVVCLMRPWPAAGLGFAERWYPDRALTFLAEHELLDGRLYNDVRFGGWLLMSGFPERRVFLDDRNEIHEPLLAEIWEIFTRSDVGAWQAMLDRYAVDTVLLRYHEPLRVTTPDGDDLGRRGFSRLWFPSDAWAMVYWDDVAMVLIRRSAAPASLLDEREYEILHPDDLEHVAARLADTPTLLAAAASELDRALGDDPDCRRARRVADLLASVAKRRPPAGR